MDPDPRVMVRGLTSSDLARCCRLPKPPPACSCQRTGCAAAAAAPARVGACPGAPGRVDSTQPASIRPAAPFATKVAGDVAAGAAAAEALDFVRRISFFPRRSAHVAELPLSQLPLFSPSKLLPEPTAAHSSPAPKGPTPEPRLIIRSSAHQPPHKKRHSGPARAAPALAATTSPRGEARTSLGPYHGAMGRAI